MAKTNKELAVELYSAFLVASATIYSNPGFQGTVKLPTNDHMVEQIQELTTKLAQVQND